MTSLWADSLPRELSAPLGAPLEADIDADVAIIGAGYTGLWTAYYLLSLAPGTRVAIIDSHEAGFGASGRNGGWCSALFPASVDNIARTYGRTAAVAQTQAMHETVATIEQTANDEGWQIDAATGGSVVAARTPVQLQRAKNEIDQWRHFGFGSADYRLLTAEETLEQVNVTDALGGVYTPHCTAIQPAKLVRSLARTVMTLGGQLFEHSPAVSVQPGVVRTDRGSIRASFIVRATEGFTATLPGFTRDLIPVYSLMLATQPLPSDVWEQIGLSQRQTFADFRHLIIYGQRTADDRIAFGGRGAPYHFRSRVRPEFDRDATIFGELWHTLTDLFPSVAGYEVTHTWGGPLGVPRDWFASCGLDRKTGMAWSGGYVGDGVGTSHLGGQTLADLILGLSTPRTQLPWVNHQSPRWEPEPLRWLGTNIGLHTMTSADNSEGRTGRPSVRAKLFSRLLGG